MQSFVNPPREGGPYTGNRPEEPLGIQAPAKSLELAPARRPEHLDDRGGDPRPDPRQRIEGRDPGALVELAQVFREARGGLGGLAIGADTEWIRGLLLQQVGRLPEPVGDDLVRRGHSAMWSLVCLASRCRARFRGDVSPASAGRARKYFSV
jgi:hypothetical protein